MIQSKNKVCLSCDQVLDINRFNKRKSSKDGYRNQCKDCRKKQLNEWRSKNPEKYRESNRRFYFKNTEKFAAWRKKNREENRGREQARYHKYYQEHKDQAKNRLNTRRSRIQNNGAFLVLEKEILRLYRSKCVACGSNENITMDHIIPIARGGTHGIGNLQPLCLSCNLSKSTKFMTEWNRP